MLILSWNLRWTEGAGPADIAGLVGRQRPDLVLLQETMGATDTLADLLPGHYRRAPMPGRRHGLAAWSPHRFDARTVALPGPGRLDLPVPLQRVLTPRHALVVDIDGLRIANVHLDHGQRCNRRGLRQVLQAAQPDAIIGDFNALGETALPGFADVGPRRTTHVAHGLVPLRLDRCLVRGLVCQRAEALPYGASDHRPILVALERRAAGA